MVTIISYNCLESLGIRLPNLLPPIWTFALVVLYLLQKSLLCPFRMECVFRIMEFSRSLQYVNKSSQTHQMSFYDRQDVWSATFVCYDSNLLPQKYVLLGWARCLECHICLL